MAKRPKMPMGGGGMDMQAMMRQAQQMQAQLEAAQEEIKELDYEASAGGGMVKVKIDGELNVQSIEIDPAAVDPEDIEMLQDMVTAAVNEAIRGMQEISNNKMGAVTGGMNLPF